MALGKNFTYAFDDSGGVEPLLNKQREFFPGNHPFFLIAALGINNDLLDSFRADWQQLRLNIQDKLRSPELPALHARLMFGENRPPTYRGALNPYLNASREDVLTWYMAGPGIIGRCLRARQGGDILTAVYQRDEGGKPWESLFKEPEAEAEGEFLKLIDRRRFPKLHQKYVAHVTAALTMPTLDIFMGIQETMRQCGGTCSVLLDGYSDADGFNDQAAFGFLNDHLSLSHVKTVSSVPDADEEPLCQAADLIAYAQFRLQLAHTRQASVEAWVTDAVTALASSGLCSVDIPRWLLRHRAKTHIQAIYNAARYALAHHEIRKYAPEIVEQYFKTPDEFLLQCQQVSSATTLATSQLLYLPILKDGVLKTWQDRRLANGEDRSKSGPVTKV